MLEDRISKVKLLLEQRERIDRELAVVFGLIEQPKRGRPKKDSREPMVGRSTSWLATEGESLSEIRGESYSEITTPPVVGGLGDGPSSK
jgi:hypothetical protein